MTCPSWSQRGLLKPLGNPQPNSVKYFATAEIRKLAKSRTWLTKIMNALGQHWKAKNRRKKGVAPFVPKDGEAAPAGAPIQFHG
jgi:hypothetical protein